MGVDSGIEIARALMARCWISAHDEEKDDRGIAVKLLKCNRNSANFVYEKLTTVDNSWHCDVRSLDVGASVCLTADTDVTKHLPSEGMGLGMNDLRVSGRRPLQRT